MSLIPALFQQLSTVQSDQQPKPPTVAAAATIAVNNFLTVISGTTDIATITPPIANAVQTIGLIFTTTSPGALLTTGNIAVGSTTLVTNKLNILVWNPLTSKWYLNS